MAQRPVFIPTTPERGWVETVLVQFQWHAGFSRQQKQLSIASLHASYTDSKSVTPRILEISRSSPSPLGAQLSAFNLKITLPDSDQRISVEAAFQGSKVFDTGGPYQDLYLEPAREAKRDPRLRISDNLIKFKFCNEDWPNLPRTAFYDWLYIQALLENPDLGKQVLGYDTFTDIEFNPARSFNCQARSAAMFKALMAAKIEVSTLRKKDEFLALYGKQEPEQLSLF